MKTEPVEQAFEYFQANSLEDSYEFAVELLYRLEEKGFCIWQTYTQDDIETNLGRKPTEDDMSAMQENLANIFEQIIPVEEV